MKTFSLHFIALLFLLSLTACHQKKSKGERELTNSVIRQTSEQMYVSPNKADSLLKATQALLTDSTCWYRLQVYRGTLHFMMHDTLQGEKIYEEVEAWCQRSQQSNEVEGLIWNHRGVNAYNQGRTELSRNCYERAFSLLNQSPKTNSLITVSVNLADAYFRIGDLPQTAFYYHYALFLCDSLNEKSLRTDIYAGLASTYMELGNFNEAHRYFDKAKKHIDSENIFTQYFYHLSLGNCFFYEKHYEEALSHFEKARDLSVQAHHLANQITCEGNMSEIFLTTGRYSQAQKCLDFCKEHMYKSSGLPKQKIHYIESLEATLNLKRGKKEKADLFLKRNVDSLLSLSPRYLMLHYARLEQVASEKHQWERAYFYRTRSENYAETLRNQQFQNNVIEANQRYSRDTTLLHQRIVLSEYKSKNQEQQSFLIIGTTVTIILGLIGFAFFLIYRQRTRKHLKTQMEEMTALRLSLARNRISPHYVFNVMGAFLPKMQAHTELTPSVNLFIDVLRDNLLVSDKVAVTIAHEISLVTHFTELHQECNLKHAHIKWDISPLLPIESLQILSMSLQIPVENAIKHAFPILTEDSTISISIYQEDKNVHLRISDNGIGYNPEKKSHNKNDTGLGLRIISQSIAILNQYNSEKAYFSITNRAKPEQGTQIDISFPIDYRYTLE